ncbi:MAG TPA: hypothetical protein VMG08_10385 [Allosphingosinicella sp.]|nr:hypothetical protein [Allosphingosinicella sp.]
MFRFVLPLAASAALLSGCGTGDGNDSADAANASRASRTENGQLTARVQGVDLKVNLPPPIRRMTEEEDFLPPRARAERGGGEGRRFHSDDPPEAVARWYRDPARAQRFSIATANREGSTVVLAGTARGGDSLRVRLTPGSAGGTDGTILVTAAN